MRKHSVNKFSRKQLLVGLLALLVFGAVFFYILSQAVAYTSNNGVVFYGDGTTTATRGVTNARSYTYGNPGTVSGERLAPQRENSNIQYVVAKPSPTNSEKLSGQQKQSGRRKAESDTR